MQSSPKRWSHILLWSIITAAFIGPGTVTTAAKAGAAFGSSLLWALWFSVLATFVLQEAAARIPILTGLSVGEAMAKRWGKGRGNLIQRGLALAVVFGCAAYQAGNLLGALLGIRLIWPDAGQWVLLPLVGLAAWLLWQGSFTRITQVLGVAVALMGVLFVLVAWHRPISGVALLAGSLVPSLPPDSELLIIALVGTTIVPYNLFLGSGMAKKGQSLGDMRWGLGVAVMVGGLISMAIVLVGTQVLGDFSLQGLADTLAVQVGPWARGLFGWGLFAAGFSSATTAPLAASITASSLLGADQAQWQPGGSAYRGVWLLVLVIGLAFSWVNVSPIPAIILAQALNGLLLPLVAVAIYVVLHDTALIPTHGRNPGWLDGMMLLVVATTLMLGLLNLTRASYATWGGTVPAQWLPILGCLAVGMTLILWWRTQQKPNH